MIALSSDRSVGGNGVYLLSFQPETEVNRIVSYAAKTGHSSFAALIAAINRLWRKVQPSFREPLRGRRNDRRRRELR